MGESLLKNWFKCGAPMSPWQVDSHYAIAAIKTYDASYYGTQLVRAIESVLLPLGWDRTDIRRGLAETREVELTEFTAARNG